MNPANRKLVVIGAGISLIAILARQSRAWRSSRHSEELLDSALADTFPASDPVAPQDYAIPENRLYPVPDLFF